MNTKALIFALWLGLMSIVLFITMGSDKSRARHARRRIPEAKLFLLALLGGGVGGFLGMFVFRHKTKHVQFVLGFPVIAFCQAIALAYLIMQ